MRAVAEGRLANTSESFGTHIDRCLGCRACEQVCPAGVEYGQLLEASRYELLQVQPQQTLLHKTLRLALKHLWSSPSRLRLFFSGSRIFRDLGLARLLFNLKLGKLISPRAHFALALLESSRRQLRTVSKETKSVKVQTDQAGESVLLFKGCVGEGLFNRVNEATERVLKVNGFAFDTPESQVCCGALHAHAGDLEGARKLARQNLNAFSSSNSPVITNAGGCGAMLLTYGHLLGEDEAYEFSSRVRDVSQQLATRKLKEGISIDEGTVTYDTSCHLLYGQKAGDASMKMLDAIPDLKFANLEGTERCCGAAGIYNLLEPEMSGRVLEQKLTNIKATHASFLATGNPGCQMHIGAGARMDGMDLRVCHPIELLDESYRKAGFYSE